MANVIFYSQIGYRPFIWRPIACYTLARWLEEHGYTCQVIEFTHLFSPQELVDYTKMFIDDSTLLIGASTTMWTTWDSQLKMNNARIPTVPENIVYAIKELKKEFPKVKTIAGGPVSYRTQHIDIFDFRNTEPYAEDSLLKLLDELSQQKTSTKLRRKSFDISNHKFSYKDHDCILPGECLPIEWGRGCIFQCTFCRDPGLGKKPGTDEKDINLMVEEFTEMYERFGTTSYYFLDDTFNASLDRLNSLEKVYSKLPFKLEFLAYNRADLLDKHPHTQDILHHCGQRGALFGIETFHPVAAKKISKPWSARRGKDFLLEIRDKWKNTHIDCHFIAGLPGEEVKDLLDTASWLKESNLGFYWFIPLIMMNDQKQGLWETNSEKFEITWKDPAKPYNWEWNDWNYTKAYNTAALLNRVVDAHSKFSMWNLGSFKTVGINMMDCINKDISYVYTNFGDVYDHEQRLFEQYKDLLKTKAGR